MWTKEQYDDHLAAAEILEVIKNQAFTICKPGISEWDVQHSILTMFQERGIKNDVEVPIVAFGVSADAPHYYPDKETGKTLKAETLILIDIWGKLNKRKAPYADITWMGYCGSHIPNEQKHVVEIVFAARDAALDYIKKQLEKGRMPTGAEVDGVARGRIKSHGYGDRFIHSTGHSIGPSHVHGRHRNINPKNDHPLLTNLGYTIEPGIYLENRFGVRSEIDFYIDENRRLIITTPVQRELIRV